MNFLSSIAEKQSLSQTEVKSSKNTNKNVKDQIPALIEDTAALYSLLYSKTLMSRKEIPVASVFNDFSFICTQSLENKRKIESEENGENNNKRRQKQTNKKAIVTSEQDSHLLVPCRFATALNELQQSGMIKLSSSGLQIKKLLFPLVDYREIEIGIS